jgi:TRAP-type transport system periplasmic protein
MKKLLILGTIIAVGAAPFALSGQAHAQAAKPKVRIAAFLPERSITVRFTFKPWIKGVRKDAGDKVTIQEFWGGALGRNPRKQVDLVLDGVTDIASVVPGYTPGRFPGFSIFELPYLFRSGTEGSEAMWRMFKAGLLDGFDNMKVVGFYTTDVYGIHTKKKMTSLADVRGMKLRSAGPVQAETVKQLGGVPIGMPITQATEALSRGVVDGVIAGFSGLTIFRMQTIAKYHYPAPLSIAPLAALMNKKTWNGLPQDVKDVMNKYGGRTMSQNGGKGFDRTAKIFKAKMDKASKHFYIPWDASKIDQARDTMRPVHDSWIKRNKNGRVKYDALLKIIADIRAGR